MKVLILNGSPKNEQRNTLKLTNSFLDGMKEYGAIEEEYIHVSQKDMKPCLGWAALAAGQKRRDNFSCIIGDIYMVVSKMVSCSQSSW